MKTLKYALYSRDIKGINYLAKGSLKHLHKCMRRHAKDNNHTYFYQILDLIGQFKAPTLNYNQELQPITLEELNLMLIVLAPR